VRIHDRWRLLTCIERVAASAGAFDRDIEGGDSGTIAAAVMGTFIAEGKDAYPPVPLDEKLRAICGALR
jgi:hypothetical protein